MTTFGSRRCAASHCGVTKSGSRGFAARCATADEARQHNATKADPSARMKVLTCRESVDPTADVSSRDQRRVAELCEKCLETRDHHTSRTSPSQKPDTPHFSS